MRQQWILSLLAALTCSLALVSIAQNEQCGSQARGALCPGGLCCSRFGFCGSTPAYCTDGCQSQCTPTPTPTPTPPTPSGGGGDLSSIVPESLFNEMLRHRSDPPNCQGGFYTYNAFIAAARSFSGFASVGDANTRRREVAAFLAQTSHETTGGWAAAPDGPYAWGYCFVQERGNPGEYCRPSSDWPCAANRRYFGRGPIQLTWNYNYGPAGRAIGSDLLGNPDAVSSDATVSFRTAFWFWMTPQGAKPSCHDVITGRWTPSAADSAAGRLPGYGLLTNIINGGVECGRGANAQVEDRIGFYRRYCGLLGVSPGNNLDCYGQTPYPP